MCCGCPGRRPQRLRTPLARRKAWQQRLLHPLPGSVGGHLLVDHQAFSPLLLPLSEARGDQLVLLAVFCRGQLGKKPHAVGGRASSQTLCLFGSKSAGFGAVRRWMRRAGLPCRSGPCPGGCLFLCPPLLPGRASFRMSLGLLGS